MERFIFWGKQSNKIQWVSHMTVSYRKQILLQKDKELFKFQIISKTLAIGMVKGTYPNTKSWVYPVISCGGFQTAQDYPITLTELL